MLLLLFSGEIGASKLTSCLGSNQNAQSMGFPSSFRDFSMFSYSNSMIPHHISMEVPEVTTLEDILQSESLTIKSPNNLKRPYHPYFRPQVPSQQSQGDQKSASDGHCLGNIEDMPSKRLKMENKKEKFHLLSPEGLPHLQPHTESLVVKCQDNQKRPHHPYLQPQVPSEHSQGDKQPASDGLSSGNIEDILLSSKRLKMENKKANSPLVFQACVPEGISNLQQQSESPVSLNSEVKHVKMGPVKSSLHENGISDADNIKLNYENVPIPSRGFACIQREQIDPTSSCEIIDNLKQVSERMGSKSMHFFSEELRDDSKEGGVRTEFIQTEPKPESDIKEVKMPGKPGVSLTELFTAEQIKKHLSSLRQSVTQVILISIHQ